MTDMVQRAKLYGVTVAWITERLDQGACDICSRVIEDLLIDHDHRCCDRIGSCGKCVRGAICKRCNNRLSRVERGFGTKHDAWLQLASLYARRDLSAILRTIEKRPGHSRMRHRLRTRLLQLDDRGRITLGRLVPNSSGHYSMTMLDDGSIILTPVILTVIPIS